MRIMLLHAISDILLNNSFELCVGTGELQFVLS